MDGFVNAIWQALREIFGFANTTPSQGQAGIVTQPAPSPSAPLAMGAKWVLTRAVQYLQAGDFKTKIDPYMVAAMAKIESNFNPNAVRSEPQIGDASVGLMQTLIRTAGDMVVKGYRRYHIDPSKLTAQDLKDPSISVYYGMAYIDWLQKNYQTNPEWVVRAYNGGPGWKNSSRGVSMTKTHWTKYQAAYNSIKGSIS